MGDQKIVDELWPVISENNQAFTTYKQALTNLKKKIDELIKNNPTEQELIPIKEKINKLFEFVDEFEGIIRLEVFGINVSKGLK